GVTPVCPPGGGRGTADERKPRSPLTMIALQTTRRLATDVLAGVSPSLLTRMTRAPLVIPYYHVVTDEDLWHVKHLYGYKSPKQFIEDLEFLLRNSSPIGLPSR